MHLAPEDAFVARAFGIEKIEELGGTIHENLMPLKTYYYAKDETLLICDYMPGGSLSDLLHVKSHLFSYVFNLFHF